MYKKVLSTLGLAGAARAACNGHDALCDRKYSEVTMVAAHNAAFVGEGPSHNQYEYPETAMDLGVRFLTTQTHIVDGEIKQCHSDCALLDAGYFDEILASIKGWLDSNPDEVVSLLIGNGDDNILIEEFDAVFESAGVKDYIYTPDEPPAMDAWPTLQEMIDNNDRLVVFMDYNADPSTVPYILDEFSHFFETPFSPTSDNFMNCDSDRPENADTASLMPFANHNLNVENLFGILTPDQENAPETNSVASISEQAGLCEDNWGRVPNVVMCDFVSVGEVIQAQDELNGVGSSGNGTAAAERRRKR